MAVFLDLGSPTEGPCGLFGVSDGCGMRPCLVVGPHVGRLEGLGQDGAVRPASDPIELVFDRGDLKSALPAAIEARPDLNVDAGSESLTLVQRFCSHTSVPDLGGNRPVYGLAVALHPGTSWPYAVVADIKAGSVCREVIEGTTTTCAGRPSLKAVHRLHAERCADVSVRGVVHTP
jgi:hypothetical protein